MLPLANLSGDKADDYFGIGLAEEITRALAKNGVRVIGRVSAAALQAKGLDERAIAKELGVTSLLTGAVQRAGGQLRINMTLVSASDGAVRWTEKYDRPIANVFAVQDEIARTVAGTLLGSLRRLDECGRTSSRDHRSRGACAVPAGTAAVQPARRATRSIRRSRCSSRHRRAIRTTPVRRRRSRWRWPCFPPTCRTARRRS